MKMLEDLGRFFGQLVGIIPRTDRREDVKAAAAESDRKLEELRAKKKLVDDRIRKPNEDKP